MYKRSIACVAAACVLGLVGCSTEAGPPPEAPTFTHEFLPLSVSARQEIPDQCMSWTLDNDEPIWVNTVRAQNEGGFHHSNWTYVPDTAFVGADGNWPCADRGFDQIAAATMGGVFFAQSTQSPTDEQRFPEGVAFLVPAHARVIGQVHALNLKTEDIETEFRFDVFTIPEADVTVRLRSMAFTNLALNIAPQATTHARMDCGLPDPDFDVYYVLPHYHELGRTLRLNIIGGPDDGLEVFRATADYGDPLGGTLDPAIEVRGGEQLRVTCEYDNPRDTNVGYGIGDQEMCVVLIYSDTERQAGGVANANRGPAQLVDGNLVTDATCLSLAL